MESEVSDYRLSIGAVPYVSHTLPVGAQRGQTVTVQLHGVNLAAIGEVSLGRELVTGKILRTSSDLAEVQLAVPRTLEPGVYNLHVDGGICRAQFVIGELPELTVSSIPARTSPAE